VRKPSGLQQRSDLRVASTRSPSAAENVISSRSPIIVGKANRINGGGGADVYDGEGNDGSSGGADGDFIRGEGSTAADGQSGSNSTSPDIEISSTALGSRKSRPARPRQDRRRLHGREPRPP
jgi:hypothetical protein